MCRVTSISQRLLTCVALTSTVNVEYYWLTLSRFCPSRVWPLSLVEQTFVASQDADKMTKDAIC